MQKFKALIKEELSGWKPFDIIWLVTVCAVITTVTLLTSNAEAFGRSHPTLSPTAVKACVVCSIIAAIIGVINVVLGGKGKLSNYFFGVISACLMIYINLTVKNFGIMLVSVYNLVMQFVGFRAWSKNMNATTHEVKKIHMKKGQRWMYAAILAVATVVLGFIMRQVGDAHPFIDAFVTSAQVLAMILMVSMFAEQWWLWIVINIASIYLFLTSREVTLALALMYMVYFVNSIIMCVKWEREACENDKIIETSK
ncbi:MAG: nicotinamide mononucleotide transporter [Bacteroidales bacterium]|nr:nicotinamide mononucleotide transporter [Bacteroidales bacterium]